jgi:5'-nucleotidase
MQKLTLLLGILLLSAFTISPSLAKEITILYTGDTHAMIYPCNCPLEPDGGVARRATLVKQLRKSYPETLLLDAGGFFAGGLMDEYTQNIELDIKRTLVNIKAMELMRYDAIAVGDDEFNFGKDFFQKNLLDHKKIPLLSCNFKSGKVLAYVIKELSGVKIGVMAVSTLLAAQKGEGLEFEVPIVAVRRTLEELRKKGVNITILLGHLSESEESVLLNEVKDIDIYISGHHRAKEEPYLKMDSTLVLRPYWQGRSLGKLTLNIGENKEITDYKVEGVRLSDKVADESQILSVLPHCFSDSNCRREGFIGECRNPGTPDSNCAFSEAQKVRLTIITARECLTCNTESSIAFLKRLFPGLDVSYLYYPDKVSEEMVRDLAIRGLPAYILGREVEEEKNFENLKANLDLKKGGYLLRPSFSGIGYFMNREKERGRIDLFISLFDKESKDLLPEILKFNPDLHFLAVENKGEFSAPMGNFEIEEDLRVLCIKKYYPERFSAYLLCRLKDIRSSWWQDCASGMDQAKIYACARGEEGKGLLRDNIGLSRELQVMFGPLILLDNREIFGLQGKPRQKDLENILKR